MRAKWMQAEKVLSLIGLCKIRVSLFSALSAVAGFLCSPHQHLMPVGPLFAGLLLLASGSSALNQYQEKDIDALMPRTAGRPLPSGRVKAGQALAFSGLLLGCGLLILALGVSLMAATLGLGTVLWYNAVYTYLKKKWAFAIVPGTIAGIMPPVIGWMAGGGAWSDLPLLYLASFFFLWQIAHSLLIICEYGKEFASAGLPSLTTIFSPRQLSRVTGSWILSLALACLLLPLFVFPCPSKGWLVLLGGAFLGLTFSALQLFRGRVFAYPILLQRLHGVLSLILIVLATQENLRRILSDTIGR